MTKNHARHFTARLVLAIALVLSLALPSAAYAAVPYALSIPGAIKSDAVRAKSLKLAPTKKTLYVGALGVGEQFSLLATVAPEGVTGDLTYASSRPAVASVDANGVVTAHKAGTATITCRTNDGSKLKRTCKVTVKNVVPTAIAMDSATVNVAPNGKIQLGYTITPSNALNQAVTWKSANKAIATVSADGVVTGIKPGKVKITATTKAGGKKATCTVNVCFADSNIYYVAIGQANYQDPAMSDLLAAAADAHRFERALRASNFGQQSIQGEVYTDLTGAQIRNVLGGLRSTYGMTERDITYVYYSGHGAGNPAGSNQQIRGALCGVDYRSSSVMSWVLVEEVRALLDNVPGTVVVVMDSCLSGQFITPKGTNAKSTVTQSDVLAFEQNVISAFSAPSISSKAIDSLITGNPKQSKYKIVVACKPLEYSYVSGTEYSVFTRYLCETAGITGTSSISDIGRLQGDKNKDGYISLKEAKAYAGPLALKSLKPLGYVQNMMVWPANDNFPLFARIGG